MTGNEPGRRFAEGQRPLLPPRGLELRDAAVRRSVVRVSSARPGEIQEALASSAKEVVVDLPPVAGKEGKAARARLLEILRARRAEQILLTLQANPDDRETWQAFEEVV